MEQWKQQIERGNDLFHQQRYADAETHYQQALDLAVSLFPNWENDGEKVAAVVVSYQNLADLYLAQHMEIAAEMELRQCYEYLWNAVRQGQQHPTLLSGLNRSYHQLLSHIKKYGSHDYHPPVPMESLLSNLSPN